jgi:hypothetical protein
MDFWHHEIDRAQSEADIVRSASDYLGLWAPKELSPAALGLREMRLKSSDEVVLVNYRLSDHPEKVASTERQAAHLRELAGYFGHAAARIFDIRRTQLRSAA